MNRPTRRILIAVGAVVALVLLILVLVPALFGGRIAARVKTEVNRSLTARVDWRDAGLGLFRNFPNLTLRLDDLTAVGTGRFAGDTLAAVSELRVVLDLLSAARSALGGSGPVVVRAVELDRPRLRLVKLADGSANWDIMKEDTTAKESAGGRPMAVSLRRFAMDGGVVRVDNRAARLRADVIGLDQELRGDFGNRLLTVGTRAHADSVSVVFAGIPYLSRVRLDLSTDIAADLATKTFTLRESGVRLNELVLAFSGSVARQGERLALDLAFGAPKTEFKHILSLVPVVYARDFQAVQASGSLAVSGKVKGEYGDDAFPSFSLRAKVDDGAFRYPDLPLPTREIGLDLAVSNPGGDADSTVVDLRRLHFVIGQNPVDAALLVRTPISDPFVDARVKGTLDLADVRRTVKLEELQELTGRIAADAAVRTRMSWVDQGAYDRVAASGTVNVSDLTVKSEALPHALAIREASLALAPRHAELRSLSGTVGSSDLRLSGSLDNLLGYLMQDQDLRGSASLASNRFNLDEWRSDSGGLNVIPVPPKIDFAFQARIGELLFDNLTMSNAEGRLRVKDQRITLENFAFNSLGGRIALTGYYETTDPARPTFDMGLRMQTVDIPSAFEAFNTVRLLAPVARYAKGNFSAELRLDGALGQNMIPLYQGLTGQGSLLTSKLLIEDFPALDKLADVTKLNFLDDPTFQAIRSQFRIEDGRLHLQPFTVPIAGTTMSVAGSNGLDQTLQYDLGLKVPQSLLGGGAAQAIGGLASRAGLNLQSAQAVTLGIRLTGKVTDPAVQVDVGSAAESVAETVQEAAEQRVEAAVDSAKLRATAEAQRLVQEAEQRAEAIRAEARTLADKVKREGYAQADSLTARASGPLAEAAAGLAADRLRQESDGKAQKIVSEADQQADALVAEAKKQAAAPPR